MPSALRVALTGGIGAGKSEALAAFRDSGAQTLCLDTVARELSGPGGPVTRAVSRAFGPGMLGPDGGLDRTAVAKMAFSDARARRRLERAAHPPILREMRLRMERAKKPVLVVDVPLLFEAGLQGGFDLAVLVAARRGLRIGRVARRGGMDRVELLRRMRAQMPQERKEALADVVLRNDGTRAQLRRAVAEYQKAFELIAASLRPRPEAKRGNP
ncbi:MAG: dephospho-CoA kinase [Elusimicrobiota bacterium]